MTTEPRIVIVEDELAQIATLRAIVEPLGILATDFRDPEQALEYLRRERVDAAIIDIHMRSRLNGLQLIRAVRAFDRDLAIIIHTGDTSIEVAEGAIELQAFRRAIKSRITIEDMRALVKAAIEETRARRAGTEAAANTVELARGFEVAMSTIDDELTAAECYQGFLHSVVNPLTALGGWAEYLSRLAAASDDPVWQDAAARNAAMVDRLIANVQAFMEGPFTGAQETPGRPACADINSLLDTLAKRFAATSIWAADQKTLRVSPLPQPFLVNAQPLKLLAALRHASEYCLQKATPRSEVGLRPSFEPDLESFLNRGPAPLVVFNRPERPWATGHIVFTLRATVVATDLETIRQSFHRYPENPRLGNVHMISLSLGDKGCAVGVSLEDGTRLSLHLCLPVAQ